MLPNKVVELNVRFGINKKHRGEMSIAAVHYHKSVIRLLHLMTDSELS